MALSRVARLYPPLLRAVRAQPAPLARSRAFSFVQSNGTFAQRRGKAVEPTQPPAPPGGQPKSPNAAAEADPVPEDKAKPDDAAKYDTSPITHDSNAADDVPAQQVSETHPSPTPAPAETEEKELTEEERTRQTREEAKQSGPLEAVLHMQAPETIAKQHPSMSPPPYVHHFDTYSLVKQLQEAGYTQAQATTTMKAIRTSLAQNLDVAQSSLVSKSDVENETYLFTAACSELSTEIKNNRRLQDEQLRQQRTHLQHEVDILQQSLNQELLTLNDNVRGMFNDRKMAVREEQKASDSAIQKISYKISIMLTSDAKSDIEAVRWILIRRSVLGILFMAVLTLGTLRYATYVSHERQREAERKKKEEEEVRRDGGKRDHTAAADAAVILAAN